MTTTGDTQVAVLAEEALWTATSVVPCQLCAGATIATGLGIALGHAMAAVLAAESSCAVASKVVD